VVLMFFGMLIGVRAALASLLSRGETRRYAWVTVVLIGIGGLLLGPIVQKHAFGAYWTGWPFGEDLTDNKTLAMWLAWVVAVFVLGRRRDPADRVARWTVAAAAVVMLAVYLVPHSLRGSQLDYAKVEGGGAAKDAITTGR
jgi:MFS family permease